METEFINLEKKEKEKELTQLTHYLNGKTGWVQERKLINKNMYKVVFLGTCAGDGDMFACYEKHYIRIYKGIKGSEFD